MTVWGLRLSWHILRRFLRNTEDRRYLALAQKWGKWAELRSYLSIFVLQGALMLVISAPVIAIMTTDSPPLQLLTLLGAVVWLIGFYFEAVGDRQLTQFLQNPHNKGKLMTTGLWRYTRHPNYFGEISQWWGIFVIALAVPYGLISIVGPLTVTILIVKVTGIPTVEANYKGRKDWQRYAAHTSKFLPLPPRR